MKVLSTDIIDHILTYAVLKQDFHKKISPRYTCLLKPNMIYVILNAHILGKINKISK